MPAAAKTAKRNSGELHYFSSSLRETFIDHEQQPTSGSL